MADKMDIVDLERVQKSLDCLDVTERCRAFRAVDFCRAVTVQIGDQYPAAFGEPLSEARQHRRTGCGCMEQDRCFRTVGVSEAEIFDRSRFDRDVLASWEAHRSRRFSGVSPSIRYIG